MQEKPNSIIDVRALYVRTTLLASAIVCLATFAFFIRHRDFIASEPAMYLTSAILSLKGQLLYVDFIPIDLPSTIICALPAGIIGLLSPSFAILSANLLSLTFSVFALSISAYILLPLRHHRQWHYFPPLILSLALANVLLIYQVGQPQYIAFYALVPYLIIRWLKYQGIESKKQVLFACGLLASVGIVLSPLTVVAPIVVETYFRTTFGKTTRLFCIESITCLSALAVFVVGTILLSNANQQSNFASIVLPLMSTDWQFIDVTTISKADVPDRRDVLILGSIFILAVQVLSRKFSLYIPLVLLFLTGMFVLVVEQNGLSRNYVLMIGCLSILAGAAVARIAQSLHHATKQHKLDFFRRNYGLWLTLWTVTPLVFTLLYLARAETRLADPKFQNSTNGAETVRSVVEQFSKPGQSILFFQRSTFPEFPLLTQMDRSAGSRLLTPGSALSIDRRKSPLSPQELQPAIALSTQLGTMMKDDIVSKKPVLIIVEQGAMASKLQEWGIAELLEHDYKKIASYQTTGANEEPHEWLGTKQPLDVFQLKSSLQTSSLELTKSSE